MENLRVVEDMRRDFEDMVEESSDGDVWGEKEDRPAGE